MTRVPDVRRGVTWVEVLLVLLVLGVVVALVLPALQFSRGRSRQTVCRSHLRQIGIALHTFATKDPMNRLGTGAYDNVRDGCADTWSWVANVHSIGVPAGEFLCDSNDVRGLETLNQLLVEKPTWDARTPPGRSWQARQPCFKAKFATVPEVREIVGEMLAEGFNTNYASSWHHVRGQPLLQGLDSDGDGAVDTDTIHTAPNGYSRLFAGDDLLDFNNVTGPLTLIQIEQSDVPGNNIPLMACAAVGETLLETPQRSDGTPVIEGLVAGAPLGRSFNNGPAFIDPADPGRIRLVESEAIGDEGEHLFVPLEAFVPQTFPTVGTDMTSRIDEFAPVDPWSGLNEAGDASGVPGARTIILQDLRGWAPVHHNAANVLMADGSVKTIYDTNGDGYFNPGLPVDPGATTDETRYADGIVEVNGFEVFTGTFLSLEQYAKEP